MALPWPLEGTDPANPTVGGYTFCQDTGSAIHPGLDLNSGGGGDGDCRKRVTTPVAGVVRAVRSDGAGSFGDHVWVESERHDWLHFCHLAEVVVAEGEAVRPGQQIGTCG